LTPPCFTLRAAGYGGSFFVGPTLKPRGATPIQL
jgi:hypothetical protein